jgi:c-di-GMP-binding flagellar brake protein YcgR
VVEEIRASQMIVPRAPRSEWNVNGQSSIDRLKWEDIAVSNFAEGGLKFITTNVFKQGDQLWLRLHICDYMNIVIDDFRFETKAEIRNIQDMDNNKYAYGVRFLDLSPNIKIRMDELVQKVNRILTGS